MSSYLPSSVTSRVHSIGSRLHSFLPHSFRGVSHEVGWTPPESMRRRCVARRRPGTVAPTLEVQAVTFSARAKPSIDDAPP